MTLRLAIIADDLTGALDTATPFIAAGLRVAVAITPDAIAAAIETGADIVAVNTASRSLPPVEAAARAAQAGTALAGAAMVMKKVDSRLKGNPGAEAHAIAAATGRTALLIAPAVPDQQRLTEHGAVTVRGVDMPIPIAPLFAHAHHAIVVRDARSQADLDAIGLATDWSGTITVGARGLGIALARRLGHPPQQAEPFTPDPWALLALGSRDPITDHQVERLAQAGIDIIDAPMGAVPAGRSGLPLLVRCSGPLTAKPELVASRFAQAIAALCATTQPATLITGGGDTALALLQSLDVSVVEPQGEAAPGLPWFWITTPGRRQMRCVVKSGGFGDANVLLDLLGAAPASDGRR